MKNRSLYLLFFLFLLTNLQAQFNNLKYTTYTTENGLTDNYIVKTATDKKGFLWIATRNGLSRFDGLQFKNYTVHNPENNGLRSSWITDLLVDDDGTVWASTEWGICYYDESEDAFRYVNEKGQLIILYKAPMCLVNTIIWAATENGLKKINTKTKRLHPTSLQHIPDPQSISTDANGKVWIGTRGHGFYLFDVKKDKWSTIYCPALTKEAHLMAFFKDGNKLWAGTSEGLILIESEQAFTLYNKAFDTKPSATVDQLTFVTSFPPITGDSLLVCGTYDKRMAVFNKKRGVFTEVFSGTTAQLYGIPNSILNTAQPFGHILWMGTDKGLCALNMHTQDYTSYLFNEPGNSQGKAMVKKIMAVPFSTTTFWLLTNNPAALLRYNAVTNKIEKQWSSHQAGTRYKTMLPGKGTTLWLIHDKGIDKFSPQAGITPVYNSEEETLFSAALDKENNLWLGTGNGLLYFTTTTRMATKYDCHFQGTPIENGSYAYPFFANAVYPDNKGRIWVSSGKYGLFCFSTETQTFIPLRQPSHEAYETKNRLSSLAFDSHGKLWVGNMNGIASYDTSAKVFTNYGQQNGLRSSYVYALQIDDDNNITGRGNSGVFFYNTKANKFINYPVPIQMSTGILEQRLSLLNGKTYVGFEGGFSVYNNQPAIDAATPVYITSYYVNGKRYSMSSSGNQPPINLDYKQNTLQINYTCVDYDSPADITYRYQLNNSGRWINAGSQRSALFTSLPPGDYTFKVGAINGTTISKNAATLKFSIQPPFWQTGLFKTGCILFLLSLIGGVFYFRVKKIKEQEAQKTTVNKAIAELEMKALRSQMNPHFIFNSLNSIQKYIWESKQEDAAEYLTKFARLIRSILENSAHKLVPLQKEITSIKLYLELEHRRSNQKFDYSISVDEAMDVNHIMIPPLLLQPYIENAIWHGLNTKKSHGELMVSINQTPENIICVIDDDGIGREASRHTKQVNHTSMGLNISKQRIDLMHKESGIHTEVIITDKTNEQQTPAGTTVTLVLPLIYSHA